VPSVISRRILADVRRLTTTGPWLLAMLRNVVASIGPVNGAGFAAGTLTVCAEDACGSPHCDEMTIPTAAEATAMRMM
jgi:hypothetical protein